MPPEQQQTPASNQPEAAAAGPFWERKGFLVPLGIAILLGGGVYFALGNQSSVAPTGVAISGNAPGTPATTADVATAETELWVVTTKFNTVFIKNAEVTPANWDSSHATVREAYESSYAKVVSVYLPVPVGLKIWDSKVSSTDANIFFVTAYDEQTYVEYAYVLNTQQKTSTKLFSSLEHPDFKLAGISGVSPDNTAIHFSFASCRDCGGVTVGEAVYNVSKRVYKNIGLTSAFRWTTNGDFEYKPVLQGCEKIFHTGTLCDYYGFGPDDITQCKACRDKVEAASWLQGSWQ